MSSETSSDDRAALMTVSEAAKFLGVETQWVYRHTAAGDLPVHKVGKFNRYDRVELAAWLAKQKRGGSK